MTKDLDAGPVYLQTELSLAGSAQEIFERASGLAFDLMATIAATRPNPKPQSGTPVIFKRRTPSESVLPDDGSLEAIYDHIRMLDADTYPKAFLVHGNFRLEFSQAVKNGGVVTAAVQITPNGSS
jgi:methionyl-tRNA formyltransferase